MGIMPVFHGEGNPAEPFGCAARVAIRLDKRTHALRNA
jgi:hypothetical protein